MANLRSKSGCWTCRLRRKKCTEDGLPCSNCESRRVVCHGYGPKPSWKDRGQKEKDEANKLQLQRRTHHRRHSEATSLSISQQSPSIAFFSPGDIQSSNLQADLLPPISPRRLNNGSNFPSWDTSAPFPNFWDQELGRIGSDSLFCDIQVEPVDGQSTMPFISSTTAQDFPSARDIESEEREIELLMQFLEEDFSQQHPSYQSTSMKGKSWLMCILKRSSTFFHASLGTSAYYDFLKTPESGRWRTESFQEYDKYRGLAISGYHRLMEASRARPRSPEDPFLCEPVICGVQLAILESLGGNFKDSFSHLDSASLALVNYWEVSVIGQPPLTAQTHIRPACHPHRSQIPAASAMERKALGFFSAVLVWSHIIHCATQKTLPLAADLYRRLLSEEYIFQSFQEAVGCEEWVLLALMDATGVSIWKQEQEAEKRLSMRELISKTDKIECFLSQRIQQHDNVQTRIFAYGVVIHIHTITSGCFPAVPEIHQTLNKVIPLWQLLSPCLDDLRRLSWAFCASASLASGTQRVVFQHILSEAASTDPLSRTVLFLKSIVEECWKILDSGTTSCNWESVMQKLGHEIHSILFA